MFVHNVAVRLNQGNPDLVRRATTALLAHNPVAVYLYRWGYAVGQQDTVDRVADRAERTMSSFLAYLCEDPEATPTPIPAINHPGDEA